MTIRLDMKKAAARAKLLLDDSAQPVVDFLGRQQDFDGGFKGRSQQSDLYYTLFAIEALFALDADLDTSKIAGYLEGFGGGESLDLVHLACLIRCRADLEQAPCDPDDRDKIAQLIGNFRSGDGGFADSRRANHGSAYGCFLAIGAYQDAGIEIPESAGIIDCINSLRKSDGGYVNEPTAQIGATGATAAALMVRHYLGEPPDPISTDWLRGRFCDKGGFVAAANVPVGDLLSTATALHSLGVLGVDIDKIKQPCLDFLDSLWSAKGGFCASWFDNTLDCEYTYYGLLALGNLTD